MIQLKRRAYPEAENLLLASVKPILDTNAEVSAAERRTAIGYIVKLYQDWGKPDQADIWQKRLEEFARPPAQ